MGSISYSGALHQDREACHSNSIGPFASYEENKVSSMLPQALRDKTGFEK
jgi:hypothetical protein